MKPFLLFAGDTYYPVGGMDDCQGSFDTLEEAKLAAQHNPDWWHILDLNTGKVHYDNGDIDDAA